MDNVDIIRAVYPGSVVFSKAGRDKGSVFIVISVEGEYAYLSDGRTRKVRKPKKKKLKHVMPVKYKDEVIAGIIASKNAAALDDAVIKKAIERYAGTRIERPD
jgi:ribosomal protein L14E/L6E/L27E